VTPIDVLAGEWHFAEHLAPVYLALPEERRGRFMHRGNRDMMGQIRTRMGRHGIKSTLSSENNPVLVASWGDFRRAQRENRTRIALMEHGAGQSYHGDARAIAANSSSYAGGPNRYADLFLHPGDDPAGRDRARYPKARVEVIGSPFLDIMPRHEPEPEPVVAVTFHFNCQVVAETRPALPHFRAAVAELAKHVKVIGHGHPRILEQLVPWYQRMGIEVVGSFDEVARRANVLVADNTSVLFAFAASGRPVVVLNPPWYRRHVNHGLRFWDAADVGVNVARPGDLVAAVHEALEDNAARQRAREAAVSLVYAHRTGAAARAAEVLLDWTADMAVAA
jgi:hypothetical protein